MAASSKKRKSQESFAVILLQIVGSMVSLTIVGMLLGVLYLLNVPLQEQVNAETPTESAEDVSNKLMAALRGDFKEGARAQDVAYDGILEAIRKPLVVRYTAGSDDESTSEAVAAFKRAIESKVGTFALTSDDLNRIANGVLKVSDSSAQVIQEMENSGASFYSVPTKLNFRIGDEKLQILSTLRVKNPLMEKDIQFLTRGNFRERSGGGVAYRPDFVYFNSVRVPPPLDGILAGSLIRQFVSGIFASDESSKVRAPSRVRIESEQLVISL